MIIHITEQEATLETIANLESMLLTLGDAIASNNWRLARHTWASLSFLHPTFLVNNPRLRHIAAVLDELEANTRTMELMNLCDVPLH